MSKAELRQQIGAGLRASRERTVDGVAVELPRLPGGDGESRGVAAAAAAARASSRFDVVFGRESMLGDARRRSLYHLRHPGEPS